MESKSELFGEEPFPFWYVLAQECNTISSQEVRTFRFTEDKLKEYRDACNGTTDNLENRLKIEANLLKLWDQAEIPRNALCFSGGGIRSACFNLGILQGLAFGDRPPLRSFQYLSTVSGGGYIGSWFSTWLRHEREAMSPPNSMGASKKVNSKQALDKLMEQMSAAKRKSGIEPEQIKLLRSNSSYLSPRFSVFSIDTWTLVTIYLRNLLISWTLFLPLLLAPFLIPVLIDRLLGAEALRWGIPQQWYFSSKFSPSDVFGLLFNPHLSDFPILTGLAIFFLQFVASAHAAWNMPSQESGKSSIKMGAKRTSLKAFPAFILFRLIPQLTCCFLVTLFFMNIDFRETFLVVFGIFSFLCPPILLFLWRSTTGRWKRVGGRGSWSFAASVLALVLFQLSFFAAILLIIQHLDWLAGYLNHVFASLPQFPITPARYIFLVLGPFFWMIILQLQAALTVGITSKLVDDSDREWLAQSASWLLLASTLLLLWFALAFLPGAVDYFFLNHTLRGTCFKAAAGAFALYTGVRGALLGRSASTSFLGSAASTELFKRADVYCATFVILFLFLLSSIDYEVGLYLWPAWQLNNYLAILKTLCILIGLPVLLSFFININKFSMHCMYRNRLVRTFLGAVAIPTRAKCGSQQLSGSFIDFCEEDNFDISKLGDQIPIQIFNMTVNRELKSNLATQERHGDSFTASSLYVGNPTLGYRRSCDYTGHNKGWTIGTAMAVSGAAVNPNMGYYSTPLVGSIMAFFNVRLGWWVGDPNASLPWWQMAIQDVTGKVLKYAPNSLPDFLQPAWKKEGPGWALKPALAELLGLSQDSRDFVNLSDGGHFDNLGLYEMIRRRCKLILCIDAGEDPTYACTELGLVLRKIRIDLGVEVNLHKEQKFKDKENKPIAHFIIGDIIYAQNDQVSHGILIYIKPTILEDAPFDVVQHRDSRPPFPHDPTLDQVFYETKFEAYRALGEYISKSDQVTGVLNKHL